MALNTNKDLKQFYTIAEVSQLLDLPATLLRYWEKEFPNIHPKKGASGMRAYTKDDIEEITLVRDLVKGRNMKLAAARELIQRNRKGATDANNLMNNLKEVRAELMAIKKELDSL